MAKWTEKVGYGLGDMSSSMFWKIFSAYLPFFYANIYGLSLEATATLVLAARVWDAVSDPAMGILADRTHTIWGKYRPYLLWMAIPFAVAGVLIFTTPDFGETGKTVWAYATYLLMMTVYTAINVPYGSMLGVMTASPSEKTTFASFRMMFAYGGSFLVLFGWEPLCRAFNQWQGLAPEANDAQSWQWGMMIVASICCILFVLTFAFTRERLHTPPAASVTGDLRSLMSNRPWWMLSLGVIAFNFLNAIRYTVIPFFFASVVGSGAQLEIFSWQMLFYAGFFLAVGEVSNIAGVALAAPMSKVMSKKATFIVALLGIMVVSLAFYVVAADQYFLLLLLQIAFCILTGVISPLLWSMYADVSDYAELQHGTASTGLIFSSSSMAQKFGAAFGTSGVAALLAFVGYDTADGAVQTPEAVEGIRLLMSVAPAVLAVVSLVFIAAYPLGHARMREITKKLYNQRANL